jgi:nucleoside-diphosphate-sugar epimerase
MTAENILITGGTGFIGSRLALRAGAAGHAVAVFAQTNTDAERAARAELEKAGVTVIPGSVTEREAVGDAIRGHDLVFHLAAAQHEMNISEQRYQDVNVGGTQNVIDACIEGGVRRLVYGSTIGVYGVPAGSLDERSPVDPDNLYGRTKLAAERLVVAHQDRLSVVAVRISETYGPGDQRLVKLFQAVQRGAFFMIGDGRNLHHPIFIADLIDGLLRAGEADLPSGEVFVLAGKEVVSSSQMVATIAEELGRPTPRRRAPMWPFTMAAVVLETALRPLGIQPPLHRRRLDFFRKSFSFSGRKAADMLGFQPAVGFREGIREAAAWYRAIGKL